MAQYGDFIVHKQAENIEMLKSVLGEQAMNAQQALGFRAGIEYTLNQPYDDWDEEAKAWVHGFKSSWKMTSHE
jgi:hypothetical protein